MIRTDKPYETYQSKINNVSFSAETEILDEYKATKKEIAHKLYRLPGQTIGSVAKAMKLNYLETQQILNEY